MEAASVAARELRKRYDLFYLHLDTQTPVRLTSVVRWAVSTSKIPPHAWKATVPTSVIEEYLAENPNPNGASPSTSGEKKRDWKLEVDKFISKCHELDQEGGQGLSGLPCTDDPPWGQGRTRSTISSRAGSISEGNLSPDQERGRGRPGLPFTDDPPRRHRKTRSVISSRAGSISEGHISPDEDGPSRKVVHHDD